MDDRNANTPAALPTADQGAERPDPGRLHNIARYVLADVQRNPPPWFQEWAGFTLSALGPQPNARLGTRGFENWNLVAMGILIAFGYFGEMLMEDPDDADPAADPAGADGGGQEEPAAEPVTLERVEEAIQRDIRAELATGSANASVAQRNAYDKQLITPTFTVLGPDGQPLIEGRK